MYKMIVYWTLSSMSLYDTETLLSIGINTLIIKHFQHAVILQATDATV